MAPEKIIEPGLPEGTYVGVFMGEIRKEYPFGERSLFEFQVDDGPETGGTAVAFCGLRATTKTNRGKYLAWLTGKREPERHMEVDSADWVGKRYEFEVTTPPDAESPRVTEFTLLDGQDVDDDVPF